jgi:hypothetical protein
VQGEYILWATSGSRIPPLITTAPPGTGLGKLGAPDTSILFGNERINDEARSGFRMKAGMWLDECHECGIEADFFYLSPTGKNFAAGSDGTKVSIFRPFFNTFTGAPGSEDVSFLGAGITGAVDVRSKTSFLGGDLNCRHKLCCCDECCKGYRIDLLAGYRAVGLKDELDIDENLNPTMPPGNILVQDRFRTSNTFHGVQVGLDGEWWCNHWFFNARGLLAIGIDHEIVDIEGETTTTPPGGPSTTLPGGLLALPTNIGHYHRDPFTFAPSATLRVGRQLTDNVRFWVGYDINYLSNVALAGNQIDPVVNPFYIPSTGTAVIGGPLPRRPAFEFHGSDYWAQGLNLALEFRY